MHYTTGTTAQHGVIQAEAWLFQKADLLMQIKSLILNKYYFYFLICIFRTVELGY